MLSPQDVNVKSNDLTYEETSDERRHWDDEEQSVLKAIAYGGTAREADEYRMLVEEEHA